MNTELQQRIIKQVTRMFLCNGIKSVTMDMIASQLGISKRTLYENFKEKNELLLACLES
ncbi:TetR/AcrR family transcriptional regulator [Barnesiella intestinihominis]|uniref:TetR/AcrR family transcriptional regulator n=1 Tax=Barnesiella intestinihominis TaxID=487174 RepID=UPI003AB1A655